MESQPQTSAIQLLCESPPWSACVCEDWPCCGCGLFPPHSLIPAAADTGQGAQTPALLSFRWTKVFSALTALRRVVFCCCPEALGRAPFTPCALKIISIGLRTYFHLIQCFTFKVSPQQFYLKVWWLYCLNTHTHKKSNYFSSRQWRIILEFSKICEIRCIPEILCSLLRLSSHDTGAYQGISLVKQQHSPDSIEKRDKYRVKAFWKSAASINCALQQLTLQ